MPDVYQFGYLGANSLTFAAIHLYFFEESHENECFIRANQLLSKRILANVVLFGEKHVQFMG